MTLTPLRETSFEDAVEGFRRFLDEQGETAPILWIFKEDVFSRKADVFEKDFWINLPVPPENEDFVREAFALAQERNVGAGFLAFARCKDGLCCGLVIPTDDVDAQYLMMSSGGLRYSVVKDMPSAKSIRRRGARCRQERHQNAD